MKRFSKIAVCCAFLLPVAASAATRSYDLGSFDSISVAAGVEVEFQVGPARSIVAETDAAGFDDLQITMSGTELHIGRPNRSWYSSGRRPQYQVRVAAPLLRALRASSGAEVRVEGAVRGDFSVSASSGSDVTVASLQAGNVKAKASSGADLTIAGQCASLDADSSSGADIDAERLTCGVVKVEASSGSDVSVAATRNFEGQASSGADVRVDGTPPVVRFRRSSGAAVAVGK
jgi:hypothetical protein